MLFCLQVEKEIEREKAEAEEWPILAEEKHTVAEKRHLLVKLANMETERVDQVAVLKKTKCFEQGG